MGNKKDKICKCGRKIWRDSNYCQSCAAKNRKNINNYIELYGDYWHNLPEYKERDKKRLKTYKKHGYKTLIIWEHELKNLNILQERINQF